MFTSSYFHQHIKNITFYGSSHNSHEILTNWLINVDNFVQIQFALLNIYNIQIYIYTIHLYIFYKEVGGGGGAWSYCYVFGGPYPLWSLGSSALNQIIKSKHKYSRLQSGRWGGATRVAPPTSNSIGLYGKSYWCRPACAFLYIWFSHITEILCANSRIIRLS